MKFELDKNEAAFIVRVMGNLPTESNAFPLWQKLVLQFNEQSKPEGEPKPELN